MPLKIRSAIITTYSVLVLAFQSCDRLSEGVNYGSVQRVVVPEFPSGEVKFEDFIDSIEILPLETNDQCMISNIYDLAYQNGKFYIFDASFDQIFVFTKSGKFIHKLSKRGKGPGEYLEIRDFTVSDNGDISVLSFKEILVYDSSMQFKKSVSFTLPDDHSVNPISFALNSDGGYYLYAGAFGLRGVIDNRYLVYKVDADGTFHGQVFFPLKNNAPESPRFFKLVGEDGYTFTPTLGNDTVYRFSANKVYPKYVLDYGTRKLPDELSSGFHLGKKLFDAGENTDYVTHTFRIIETSEILSYSFEARKHNIWFSFHSKATGKSFCYPFFGEFGAKGKLPIIRSGVDRTFYGHMDSHLLKASRKSGDFKRKLGYLKNYDSLDASIGQLNENDNPAIMVVKLKAF